MRRCWNRGAILAYFLLSAAPAVAGPGDGQAVYDAAAKPYYENVVAMTVAGAATPPGRAVGVACTVAGNATFTMQGGASYQVPLSVGYVVLPLSVTAVSAATATCTYANLY